jgi:hypothetical protein
LRNGLSLALFQQRLTLQEVQAAWLEVENDCENTARVLKLLCPEFLGGVAAPPYQGCEEFCPAPILAQASCNILALAVSCG